MKRAEAAVRANSRGCALVAALLAALLGLLAGLYPWLTTGSGPRDPILSPGTPIPDALRYQVMPGESQLELTVNATIGRVSGEAEMRDGTIELVRDGAGWHMVANLAMDVSSFNVGNEFVNRLVRLALAVETYPIGVFQGRSATPIPAREGTFAVDLHGLLELHGVVRDYTFPATLTFAGDRLTLVSTATIDATEFGVSIPGIVGSNELEAAMHIVTVREGSGPPSGD